MIEVRDIVVLEDAAQDMSESREFYDAQERGLGQYFWDCIITDIESLIVYAGVHQRCFGLFRLLSRRFPFAIYYEISDSVAYVMAVLPMRRDPAWVTKKIGERR